MEKLSAKKKVTIIRMYLGGYSHGEIATKAGVSTGAVSGIVTELKAGAFPEVADLAEQVELLRELSLDLKHAGQTPGQCAVGLAVLNRIKECGLEVADIERWPAILKVAETEQGTQEFVDMVYHIQDAQEKTGLTLEEIDKKIHKLETTAAELEPTLKKLDDLRQEIAELTKQRDDLIPAVSNLKQKHDLLNPIVKSLEKREKDLELWIKDHEAKTDEARTALANWSKERQRVLKTGFSLETLAEFNYRTRTIATRHHIAISELRERLLHELECLNKGLGLETLIKGKQTELQKYQQAIVSAKEEQHGLNSTITNLKHQKTSLEADIKVTRENVSDEIRKLIPAAREVVAQFDSDLRHGNDEALKTVRRMKDEALEIGKEIGRYEEIVETNLT